MDPTLYAQLLQDGLSSEGSVSNSPNFSQPQNPGSNFRLLIKRFFKVAAPYWSSEDRIQARLRLAGLFALTVATTCISVGFNFLGRDFYNALADKNPKEFGKQLMYYLGAFVLGIPVFVLRDYWRELLALRWRSWLTSHFLALYFENRTFHNIEAQALIDNPDQRIVHDVSSFTGTALAFALACFNAVFDLVSFSGILYGIYPPLFVVLIAYSIGGTVISVFLGKGLVGLNFTQEKKDADFRYGLVRVRENSEAIAFYGGEGSEIKLLLRCFRESFDNLSKLLKLSRNLNFFTSGYRHIIQLLPAVVVAPLYFSGKIDFGVVNQSFSAFEHIFGDLSIVVFQFQSISAFTAVVDRLGEFTDILDQFGSERGGLVDPHSQPKLSRAEICQCRAAEGFPLLAVQHLTVQTPQYSVTLVEDLSFVIKEGKHLLIMGPSGSGKTSLLRAIAGLWQTGRGTITTLVACAHVESATMVNPSQLGGSERIFGEIEEERNDVPLESGTKSGKLMFFLPQKPYMVVGSLRQQLLYPTWISSTDICETRPFLFASTYERLLCSEKPVPTESELYQVLERVRLCHLMNKCDGLDSKVEWSSILSHGEQQRIAFARLLLSKPRLVLLDESTSAMDEEDEAHIYREVEAAKMTYVSVAHRKSLRRFHTHLLSFVDNSTDIRGWTLEELHDVCPSGSSTSLIDDTSFCNM